LKIKVENLDFVSYDSELT